MKIIVNALKKTIRKPHKPLISGIMILGMGEGETKTFSRLKRRNRTYGEDLVNVSDPIISIFPKAEYRKIRHSGMK